MKRIKMTVSVMAMAAVLVVAGLTVRFHEASADSTYKQIQLRGKGLASIAFVSGLFSTGAYDTTDFALARPEQRQSVRGPIVCWGINQQVISFGANTNDNPIISVFIQHAPTDTEAEYRNFMMLSSLNSIVLNNGMGTGGAALVSNSNVNEIGMAANTTGAFGRFIRARFSMTGGASSGNTGVQYAVLCDLSGDR